jgi:hypothetical protein
MVFTIKQTCKILQDLSSVVDPNPVGSGIIVAVPNPDPDSDKTFLTQIENLYNFGNFS